MTQLVELDLHQPSQTIAHWRVRGLRGATTVTHNSAQAIASAVTELLDVLELQNRFDPEELVSVTFSVTPDLDALFPASVARRRPGWNQVPLLDVQHMQVAKSLKRCIRVLIHLNTPLPQKALRPAYLRDAAKLRPDLAFNQLSPQKCAEPKLESISTNFALSIPLI